MLNFGRLFTLIYKKRRTMSSSMYGGKKKPGDEPGFFSRPMQSHKIAVIINTNRKTGNTSARILPLFLKVIKTIILKTGS